jgi:hypothetical protein
LAVGTSRETIAAPNIIRMKPIAFIMAASCALARV